MHTNVCVLHAGVYREGGYVYEGDFFEDVISGQGRFTFESGAYYEGSWVSSKMNGKGTYAWPDGRRYEVRVCVRARLCTVAWTESRCCSARQAHAWNVQARLPRPIHSVHAPTPPHHAWLTAVAAEDGPAWRHRHRLCRIAPSPSACLQRLPACLRRYARASFCGSEPVPTAERCVLSAACCGLCAAGRVG